MKYYVQRQSKSGYWFDSLGTNALSIAENYVAHQTFAGEPQRIVERSDAVVGSDEHKLLLAAPALQAALDAIVAYINEEPHPGSDLRSIRKIAREAINKATGE